MGMMISLKPVVSYTKTKNGHLKIWCDKTMNEILKRIEKVNLDDWKKI